MGRKTQQPGGSSHGMEKGRDGGAKENLLSGSIAAAVAARRRKAREETAKAGDGAGRKKEAQQPAKEKEPRAAAGRDAATPTTATGAGRLFFKIFLAEQSAERLNIPYAFREYLQDGPVKRHISLKGPSGNTWPVVLTSDSQGLGFTEGWKTFACDHSLATGQFLLFTYDGHTQFSVAVFCISGVEEKSAISVQPSKEVVVKVEEEGATDINVASMPQASAPTVEEGNGTRRKRARQAPNVIENDTTPKTHSSVQKKAETRKPEATFDASKAALGNIIKGLPCRLNDYSSRNMACFISNNAPRIRTFVSKKSRQPVMISQRRPVTEEEKNNALERARKFESKNPFVVQVMMESYVYLGFFMNIPCEFVREFLPRASTKMKLLDPHEKSWDVNYVYYHDRNRAAFSGGWSKFAIGNNLEKFDVCVFELLKEDNIKVHIYRVVQDFTPLIRKSSI